MRGAVGEKACQVNQMRIASTRTIRSSPSTTAQIAMPVTTLPMPALYRRGDTAQALYGPPGRPGGLLSCAADRVTGGRAWHYGRSRRPIVLAGRRAPSGGARDGARRCAVGRWVPDPRVALAEERAGVATILGVAALLWLMLTLTGRGKGHFRSAS